MSKTTGLASHFWVGAYDLSGDTSALDMIKGGPALLDITGLNKSAHERIGGLRDGDMQFTSFFNPSANAEHIALSPLPTSDTIGTFMSGGTLGNPMASINAKQINYDPTRGTDGSLTEKVELQANGFGLEWGVALTAGPRTDATATNGTAVDSGQGFSAPAVPASTTPVTNTSPLPASVVISGGTLTNVSVNGVTVGAGDGTYTVPAGATIAITYSVAPTWTWTLGTSSGAQAYLHVTAFTGTSVDVAVQHSADNSTWSNLIDFGSIAAVGAQRLTATGTVNRYLRAITGTGTFTSITFAVNCCRNQIAVSF
ncbi:MAG TPA: hypothetical protein VHX38_18795 [Pseudonocardiaceae bacterium]|jgi:hypothetical protein|nr:hypothetical protein [Pseudonocardiaceae bacterium]